jgi:hypothetical protein
LIGIYKEYDPYDFKNYYIKNLYEYFSLCDGEKDVTISKFTNYINKLYRFEKNPNERRMLRFLSDYLYAYEDLERYEKIFTIVPSMKLNGEDINNYTFVSDSKGNMMFIEKKDNRVVTYGSEQFFYLIYAKFYEDYMKIQNEKKYYNDFNGIYDMVLSKNFEKEYMILDLVSNNNMDIVYKEMYIIASGYYAFRKISIPFNVVRKIIDERLIKLKKLMNIDNN